LSLKLSDTRVYEPQIRATAHFCEVVVLKLRAVQKQISLFKLTLLVASSGGAEDVTEGFVLRGSSIIIIINFLFITLTCNAETWNSVIKSFVLRGSSFGSRHPVRLFEVTRGTKTTGYEPSLAQCVGQHVLLDVLSGAVLALVVRQ